VADHPDRFARVVIANTGLPTGDQPIGDAFMGWLAMSQGIPEFDSGAIVQSATLTELPADVVAAYNAPFPDESYKAGPRVMPALVPIRPDQAGAAENRAAWERLRTFERPFLTLFSDQDPITRGWDALFLDAVPGATRPAPRHDRGRRALPSGGCGGGARSEAHRLHAGALTRGMGGSVRRTRARPARPIRPSPPRAPSPSRPSRPPRIPPRTPPFNRQLIPRS
jgi:hypothetical protein